MLQVRTSLILLISITTITLLSSCGGNEEPQQTIEREETKDTLATEVKADLGRIRANIPSPQLLMPAISEAGINYDKGLLNPSSRASSYATNYQAALNLGVYGADLGYAAAYNQNQDVIEYISQVKKLSDKLGISSAFDEEFAKEIANNLGNPDTLAGLISEAYVRAENNLRSNERVGITALILTGGWVEGLYIASSAAIKSKEENAALNSRIWNHIFAFKYIVDLLNHYKDNPDVAKALEELQGINEIINTYQGKTNLGSKEMPDLHAKVSELRKKIAG